MKKKRGTKGDGRTEQLCRRPAWRSPRRRVTTLPCHCRCCQCCMDIPAWFNLKLPVGDVVTTRPVPSTHQTRSASLSERWIFRVAPSQNHHQPRRLLRASRARSLSFVRRAPVRLRRMRRLASARVRRRRSRRLRAARLQPRARRARPLHFRKQAATRPLVPPRAPRN